MTWEWTAEKAASKYHRQLKLTFKRYEAHKCLDCPASSPVLEVLNGKRPLRCPKHLEYQRGRRKKLVNGKEEGK